MSLKTNGFILCHFGRGTKQQQSTTVRKWEKERAGETQYARNKGHTYNHAHAIHRNANSKNAKHRHRNEQTENTTEAR